jgi:hypothetical protein
MVGRGYGGSPQDVRGYITHHGSQREFSPPTPKVYHPESIVFAIDLDAEASLEGGTPGFSQLECIRQAVTFFVRAKAKVNVVHRFGLVVMKVGVESEGMDPCFFRVNTRCTG